MEVLMQAPPLRRSARLREKALKEAQLSHESDKKDSESHNESSSKSSTIVKIKSRKRNAKEAEISCGGGIPKRTKLLQPNERCKVTINNTTAVFDIHSLMLFPLFRSKLWYINHDWYCPVTAEAECEIDYPQKPIIASDLSVVIHLELYNEISLSVKYDRICPILALAQLMNVSVDVSVLQKYIENCETDIPMDTIEMWSDEMESDDVPSILRMAVMNVNRKAIESLTEQMHNSVSVSNDTLSLQSFMNESLESDDCIQLFDTFIAETDLITQPLLYKLILDSIKEAPIQNTTIHRNVIEISKRLLRIALDRNEILETVPLSNAEWILIIEYLISQNQLKTIIDLSAASHWDTSFPNFDWPRHYSAMAETVIDCIDASDDWNTLPQSYVRFCVTAMIGPTDTVENSITAFVFYRAFNDESFYQSIKPIIDLSNEIRTICMRQQIIDCYIDDIDRWNKVTSDFDWKPYLPQIVKYCGYIASLLREEPSMFVSLPLFQQFIDYTMNCDVDTLHWWVNEMWDEWLSKALNDDWFHDSLTDIVSIKAVVSRMIEAGDLYINIAPIYVDNPDRFRQIITDFDWAPILNQRFDEVISETDFIQTIIENELSDEEIYIFVEILRLYWVNEMECDDDINVPQYYATVIEEICDFSFEEDRIIVDSC